MVARTTVISILMMTTPAIVAPAQEVVFANGFESGGTQGWSATIPPLAELGEVTGIVRADHFGWRPGDTKVAVALELGGEGIELRRVGDNALVGSFTASSQTTDEDSGDEVALVDFSSVTDIGTYYLYHPGGDERSYNFQIANDIYGIVGEAAVKSFYFQRCNQSRGLPYAGDALGGHPGAGGQWVDAACHGGDGAATAGPGSPDHGPLDLHGGWHDAGDYQKTLWGRGVGHMLWGYELNPDGLERQPAQPAGERQRYPRPPGRDRLGARLLPADAAPRRPLHELGQGAQRQLDVTPIDGRRGPGLLRHHLAIREWLVRWRRYPVHRHRQRRARPRPWIYGLCIDRREHHRHQLPQRRAGRLGLAAILTPARGTPISSAWQRPPFTASIRPRAQPRPWSSRSPGRLGMVSSPTV